MTDTDTRLLLAYDATCGTCRAISWEVARASADRLNVVPLGRPDVREWRERALGSHAPWVPTLLLVRGEDVRAWTGLAMAPILIRRLGPRHTLAVVHALGRLRHDGRRSLPRLAVGAATAAQLLLTGKAPIPAARENDAAAQWVATHRGDLPHDFDQVTEHPAAYQTAIFAASPPDVQSHLWVEALKRDQAKRSDLTAEQAEVFDRAIELAHDQRLFIPGRAPDPDLDQRLASLRRDATRQFPRPAAHRLLVTLGEIR
jgi:hypothetical protein